MKGKDTHLEMRKAGSVWRHLGVTSACASPGLTLIMPGCQSTEHMKVKNNLQKNPVFEMFIKCFLINMCIHKTKWGYL